MQCDSVFHIFHIISEKYHWKTYTALIAWGQRLPITACSHSLHFMWEAGSVATWKPPKNTVCVNGVVLPMKTKTLWFWWIFGKSIFSGEMLCLSELLEVRLLWSPSVWRRGGFGERERTRKRNAGEEFEIRRTTWSDSRAQWGPNLRHISVPTESRGLCGASAQQLTRADVFLWWWRQLEAICNCSFSWVSNYEHQQKQSSETEYYTYASFSHELYNILIYDLCRIFYVTIDPQWVREHHKLLFLTKSYPTGKWYKYNLIKTMNLLYNHTNKHLSVEFVSSSGLCYCRVK